MLKMIFTLGYQLRDIDEYVDELLDARVEVVVDVRENAWSHKRGFSKTALGERLGDAGIAYIHASFAGNPKELRSAADTHAECLHAYADFLTEHPTVLEDFDTLMRDLLGKDCRVCLLCYERHPDDCHRSILIDHWAEKSSQKPEVVHLGKDGAERFVTA